jgi:hypothetical protein
MHGRLAIGIAVLEDLDYLAHQTRIGCSRSIQVEDAALAILIYVAHRLPRLQVRIFGERQRRQGEAFVAGSAERAPRLQVLADRDVTVLSETGLDGGKMNLQLIANEENQDRTHSGKDEAGGMIAFVFRARKHVGDGAADDRSDDAKHNRPEERYMHVHHRFCDNPRE